MLDRMSAVVADPVQTKATPIIRIEGLTKRFGAYSAVDGVDLDVANGEIVSLLGGSGCGKTTLLRMIAGFDRPSEGRIMIDGEDMSDVPPYRRPINMMFQSYAVFPHMDVFGNVAYGLRKEGIRNPELMARVEDALAVVQMEGFAKRKPHELSGGQRQRVALARAIIKRPKILLLDEPLGALDKKLREKTQVELVNIQRSLGITFLIVTHDQEEALSLSHRVAVMNRGRFVQIGSPYELYNAPTSRFVADFIGSVNLIEGTVRSAEDDMMIVESSDCGLLRVRRGDHVPAIGTAIWLAIRPEKLLLSSGERDEEFDIDATVETITYFGPTTRVELRLPSGRALSVSQQSGAEQSRLQTGDRVKVGVRPDHARIVSE